MSIRVKLIVVLDLFIRVTSYFTLNKQTNQMCLMKSWWHCIGIIFIETYHRIRSLYPSHFIFHYRNINHILHYNIMCSSKRVAFVVVCSLCVLCTRAVVWAGEACHPLVLKWSPWTVLYHLLYAVSFPCIYFGWQYICKWFASINCLLNRLLIILHATTVKLKTLIWKNKLQIFTLRGFSLLFIRFIKSLVTSS